MLDPAYSLFRKDPFADLRRLAAQMDRAFDRPTGASGFPAVNLWHNEDSLAVTAELPGVAAADLDVSVKDQVLTISGQRRRPELGEGAQWQMAERGYGSFSRNIGLPFRVDPDRVEAHLRDGVLMIALHRPEADRARRIEIRSA